MPIYSYSCKQSDKLLDFEYFFLFLTSIVEKPQT